VLDKLVLERQAPAASIKDLIEAADRPWAEQHGAVFG
jgi:hypothetical protein